MTPDPADLLPDRVRFHCQICNRYQSGTAQQLDRYVKDETQWPQCCGARMAVILTDTTPNWSAS